MRKILFTITFLFLFTTIGLTQTIQLGVRAINTEYRISSPIEVVEDNQGISVLANAKVYQSNETTGKPRISGIFEFQQDSFGNAFPIRTYYGGIEASLRFKFFQPFVRAKLGFDRIASENKFSREYEFGARLVFGNVYVEPLSFGYKATEATAFPSAFSHKLYSGVGFNFN